MQGDGGQEAPSSLSVVRIGPQDGVLLESSFHGGLKKEVLRSLCQVANETRMDLEVAITSADEELEGWQALGPSPPSTGGQRLEEQVRKHSLR